MRSDNTSIQRRAIKIRIYPTEKQAALFMKTFGCCRFVWNKMLEDEQEFYAATDKHFIPTPAKYKREHKFLAEVDSLALANAQMDLNRAFNNFFENPKKYGYPNFKSRKRSKFTYTTNCQYNAKGSSIEVFKDAVKLPKIGLVRAYVHRKPMPGWKLKSATVSKSPSGKYFCSLLYEFKVEPPKEILPTLDTTIGLDYSSPDFYVDDHGKSPTRPRWFRESEERIARMQRKLTRMKRDSKNYIQLQQKLRELQEHVANQRKDFCHKLSREISNSYDAVCVEDLDLHAISRSLKLGKSTLDNGSGMFRTFLEYKLQEQGKHLIKVDKWFPSSKTCHNCGYINKELKLGDRAWVCPNCGRIVLRDSNAAENIKTEGLREFYISRGLPAA